MHETLLHIHILTFSLPMCLYSFYDCYGSLTVEDIRKVLRTDLQVYVMFIERCTIINCLAPVCDWMVQLSPCQLEAPHVTEREGDP